MSAGIKANNDGSAAIQVGGSDAIQISAALNTTLVGSLTVAGSSTALYPLVSATAQTAPFANTSSIDFTGIPSTAKRITVVMNGLSYAAAGVGTVRIGSGTLVTTGYTSNTMTMVNAATSTSGSLTTGFGLFSTTTAAVTVNGVYTILNITGNTWSFSEQIFRDGDATALIGNGFITLGGVLDRLSLVATTSTFDAGTVNIMWE